MKRLGFYTGTIYTQEQFDNHEIHECCVLIPDELESEEQHRELFLKKHMACIGCNGCPASQLYTF